MKAVVDLPAPKIIEEFRSVLGMITAVRKFVSDLSTVLAPLVELTKKELVNSIAKPWSSEHDEAFAKVKDLVSKRVLHFPDFTEDFVVHVDASQADVGAFFAQKDGDGLNVIAHLSQRFNNAQPQNKYLHTRKESYAVFLAKQHWRPYLKGGHFEVVTDHTALRDL